MHRFFVPTALLVNQPTVTLRGPIAHQMARVLRLRPGEPVGLFDGSGHEWQVTLTAVAPAAVQGTIVAITSSTAESRLRLTLVQALLKGDATSTVIQKAVEVGVAAIVPVVTERCITRAVEDHRLARWRRIAQEAAEQSGRALVPPVTASAALPDALAALEATPTIVLWEGERAAGLAAALRSLPAPLTALALVVGPEGGLTAGEVERAAAAGAIVASLGPRVLRADTAGLVAAAAVLFAAGDLGGPT
ncbi:MAG: 16S rRNA (uracil(1498)-N(3))-methyltransferase [Chloroflexi bacterium]|nr:16S rRNA (uracil(1498)-N(3))-methyltransferase [Chloroflexota bacterium]